MRVSARCEMQIAYLAGNLHELKISERRFQQAVIAVARECHWRIAHFRPGRVKRDGKEIYETPVSEDGAGFLDLELVRERLVKVELKVPPNTPSENQLAWYEAYLRAGVECHLWFPIDWPTILKVLK